MYIIKKIYHSLSLILIFYIFLYSNYGSARNLELKIIGNKNLDKEFVESIIDIDSESDKTLPNQATKPDRSNPDHNSND